jgi:hypothetical protein
MSEGQFVKLFGRESSDAPDAFVFSILDVPLHVLPFNVQSSTTGGPETGQQVRGRHTASLKKYLAAIATAKALANEGFDDDENDDVVDEKEEADKLIPCGDTVGMAALCHMVHHRERNAKGILIKRALTASALMSLDIVTKIQTTLAPPPPPPPVEVKRVRTGAKPAFHRETLTIDQVVALPEAQERKMDMTNEEDVEEKDKGAKLSHIISDVVAPQPPFVVTLQSAPPISVPQTLSLDLNKRVVVKPALKKQLISEAMSITSLIAPAPAPTSAPASAHANTPSAVQTVSGSRSNPKDVGTKAKQTTAKKTISKTTASIPPSPSIPSSPSSASTVPSMRPSLKRASLANDLSLQSKKPKRTT